MGGVLPGKRTGFSKGLLLLTFSFSLLADIPDSVNTEKFKAIWQKSQEQAITARREADDKGATLAKRIQEKQQLQTEKSNLESELRQNLTTVESLRSRNESLSTEIAQTQKTIQDNIVSSQTLTADEQRLAASITATRQDLQAQAQTTEAALRKVSNLRSLVDEKNVSLRNIQNNLKIVQDKLGGLSGEITRLRGEMTQLETKQQQFTRQKRDYDSEQETLRSRRPFLQDQLKTSVAELNRIDDQLKRLRGQCEDKKREVDNLTKSLGDYDQSIQTWKNNQQEWNQKKTNAERVVAETKKNLQSEKQNLSALDIEKQKLDELLPILTNEVEQLRKENNQLDAQIASVKDQLAKATDPKDKEKLQQQLNQLQAKEQVSAQNLAAKEKSQQETRQALLQIPNKKSEIRTRILGIENELSRQEDELNKAIAQIQNITEKIQGFVKSKDDAIRLVDQKNGEHKALVEDSKKLEIQADRQKGRAKEADEALEDNEGRRRQIDQLLVLVSQSLQTIEFEAIPQTQRQLTTANTTRDEQLTLETRYQQEERTGLRDIADTKVSLDEADRIASREKDKSSSLESKMDTLERDRLNIATKAKGLLASNTVLERTVTQLNDRITANKTSLTQVIAVADGLRDRVATTDRKIKDTLEFEKIAETNFQLADQAAKRLEDDASKAQSQYSTVLVAYQSQKAGAVSAGFAAGKAHGALEGKERGTPDGTDVGKTDGTKAGTEEGASEGKKRDYQEAFAGAQKQSYDATLASAVEETPEQKALRLSSPVLQEVFTKGNDAGRIVGKPLGLAAGDTKEKEEEGFRQGYATGKSDAEAESRKTHRPLGRNQMEAEILKTAPKTKEKRDAATDTVGYSAPRRPGIRPFLRWLGFTDYVQTAEADLVGATPKTIPPVAFSQKKYDDSYQHPDFVEAYRKAYDESYETSYKETYKSAYEGAYRLAHEDSRRRAKADALALTYPDEVKRGQNDGTSRGTFEGLGYNVSKRLAFAQGKSEGEAKALARGNAAGKEKGYAENLAVAQKAELEIGRSEMQTEYRNNTKLNLIDGTLKLVDGNADGKFEIGEKLSLLLSLRNFGGVAADKGKTVFQIENLVGAEIAKTKVAVGEIASDAEVEWSNLFVGKVAAGQEIAFKLTVLHNDTRVASVNVKQEIHAPYRVLFTYYYDTKSIMRVSDAGVGSGYRQMLWVEALAEKEVPQGVQFSITSQDKTLTDISVDGQQEWTTLNNRNGVWAYEGFWLYAKKAQGLDKNKFRVRLRDKDGKIVFDKIVDAPAEVRQ